MMIDKTLKVKIELTEDVIKEYIEQADKQTLVNIIQSIPDDKVKDVAIFTLSRMATSNIDEYKKFISSLTPSKKCTNTNKETSTNQCKVSETTKRPKAGDKLRINIHKFIPYVFGNSTLFIRLLSESKDNYVDAYVMASPENDIKICVDNFLYCGVYTISPESFNDFVKNGVIEQL